VKLFIQIVLIVAGVLVVLGGILVGVAILRGGEFWRTWQYSEDAIPFTKQFDAANVRNITVDTSSHAIEIVLAADDKITVTGQDDPRRYYTVEVVGDTLRIVNRSRSRNGFVSLFNWSWGTGVLRVALPADMLLGNVNLNSTSGGIRWESYPANMENCTVDNTSGGIHLHDLVVSGTLQVENTSGQISLQRCHAELGIRVDNTSGSITIFSCTTNGDLRAESTSGRISVEQSRAVEMRIDNTSGRIELRGVIFTTLRCDNTSGSIAAALPAGEYRVKMSSVTGSKSSAFGNIENAEKSIHMQTVSGSIRITQE